MAKKKPEEELDTQTSFADMNVDGFRWYDPKRKEYQKKPKQKVSRKEYWQMVRAAYIAILPFAIVLLVSLLLVFFLFYLWLT